MNSAEVGVQKVELVLRNKPGSILVVHQFGEKAKQEIRDKQQKKVKKIKAERKPEAEFVAAKYYDMDGNECIPLTALKKSIVTAATAFEDITKVGLRQALFVEPIAVCNVPDNSCPLIPIENHDGTPATGMIREDAVTIGINTRGLCYRPMYKEWQVRIRIEFNPRIVSLAQLLALVEQAGWGVGICESRPERTSALGWGRFIIHKDARS